jgi:TolB-like protein
MSSPLNRLKDRKLVEWTLAYLAGAWLVMQLVEVLSDRWPLPLGLQRGTDLVLLVGLFITITLAWYHGEKGRQRVTGPELLIVATLLFIGGTLLTVLTPADPTREESVRPTNAALVGLGDALGIAVLPLSNLSADADQDYFVSGMHEALISTLSRIEALRVISRTSVTQYADTDRPLPEIARELGVDAVIEGSVNPVGDRVRITVQLIDGRTDAHMWAEEYDRDLRDVLVLMSQVAQSVAEQVEVALAPQDAELLRSAEPVDPELHDLILRGNYSMGLGTAEGVTRAIPYYREAIRIDSTFALGWVGLAAAYSVGAYFGAMPASEAMAEAERAATRAVALDDELSGAHTSLGWVRLWGFRWEDARRAFANALELDPNDVNALHGFGDCLALTGGAEDGMAYVRRARNADPFSPIWGHTVVGHLVMMGRYEEAIVEAEALLESLPNSPVRNLRGSAYWQLGRTEEALADFRVSLARRPALVEALESGYAGSGATGAVRAVADAAAEEARGSGSGALGVALWYARADDRANALAWLERAYDNRSPDLVYVGIRSEFDLLHSEEGFRSILERMGLPSVDQ